MLHSLRDAANEEAYALAMNAAERQTGRTPDAILRAYQRHIGGLPPGKPRRRPSFTEWLEGHRQEADQPAPRTQAEALRDAWDATRAQGTTLNERQPAMRVDLYPEFFQQGGRVMISGGSPEFGGREVRIVGQLDDPENTGKAAAEQGTPKILLKGLPAGGAVKGVRSFGSDT